ncbi:MAG: hypothetical protein DRG78_20695 [Epsilonproteobacteria bacterium]|nr:MAG: hypothetical protein DRG78_20695 [Campylobacterota bacterium]
MVKEKIKLVSGEEKEVEIKDRLSIKDVHIIMNKTIKINTKGSDINTDIDFIGLVIETLKIAITGVNVEEIEYNSAIQIFNKHFAKYFTALQKKN